MKLTWHLQVDDSDDGGDNVVDWSDENLFMAIKGLFSELFHEFETKTHTKEDASFYGDAMDELGDVLEALKEAELDPRTHDD